MNCAQIREQLTDYGEGLLAPVAAAALRAHLAGCAGCTAAGAALEALRARLGARAAALHVGTADPARGAALEDEIMRRVAAARPSHQRRRAMRKYFRIGSMVGAAAAVAFAVLLSLRGTTQHASAAEQLAQAVSATNGYQGWVHVTASGNLPSAPGNPRLKTVEMHWSTTDQRAAVVWVYENARQVRFDDAPHGTRYEWHSLGGRIEKGPLPPPDPADDSLPMRIREYITGDALVQRFQDVPPDVERVITRTVEGDHERFDCTLRERTPRPAGQRATSAKYVIRVDAQSRLIRRIDLHEDRPQVTIDLALSYSYGPPTINGLADLGVPEGTALVEAGPRGRKPAPDELSPEAARVLERVQPRIAAFAQREFVAVETEARARVEGAPRPAGVRIWGQRGRRGMFALYRVSKARPNPALGELSGWPRPSAADVLAALPGARAESYMCWTVDGSMQSALASADPPGYLVRRFDDPNEAAGFRLGEEVWPGTHIMDLKHGPRVHIRVGLERDELHPGLDGIVIEETFAPEMAGYLGGKAGERGWKLVLRYWLDPARDDVPVERVHETVRPDGVVLGGHRRHDVRLTQLADGAWVPQNWQVTYYAENREPKSSGQVQLTFPPPGALPDSWLELPAYVMEGSE